MVRHALDTSLRNRLAKVQNMQATIAARAAVFKSIEWARAHKSLFVPFLFLAIVIVLPFSWSHPPNGTYVAVLGVGAAIATFRTGSSAIERAVWIFSIILLAFLEVHTLATDRDAHDRLQRKYDAEQLKHFNATMDRFDSQLALSTEEYKTILAIATNVTIVAKKPSQQIVVQPTTFGNLKQRLVEQSQEILNFLLFRDTALRGFYAQHDAQVKLGKSANRWSTYKGWLDSTSGGFRSLYEPKVIKLRDECKQLHTEDPQLNELINSDLVEQTHPFPDGTIMSIHPETVRRIAERLSALAGQIPQ